jgi:histidine triad (HIT) family protein
MKPDCVFCKIVRGEIPSARVYEDETALAILDIGPIVKGHTLVIPKEHHDPLTATPPPILHHLIDVVQHIAKAQMEELKADGVNVTQANGAAAGQIIPHIHFHVIPRFLTDGHHWNWTQKKYESSQEMQSFGERLHRAMSRSEPCR